MDLPVYVNCENSALAPNLFPPFPRINKRRHHLLDDRELWKRISEGNADAFEAWYRDTAPRLRAFLRHCTGSGDSAADLMQDVYTQIWRRPQGFDPDRGTLRTWLFGIARKQAAEWWRKQRPMGSIDQNEPGQEGELVQPASETRSIVSDALDRLTADERSLLWLREVEGQSYAEIAGILDIPIGTVRSRLFAARQALREIWQSAPQMNGGRS
jgi:RNA polymerase sigma-70 factor (ECF subfamily)